MILFGALVGYHILPYILLLSRLANVTDDEHLYGVNGSSGGYAETIFRHAAKALFGRDIEGPLLFRMIRNSDFREISLEVRSLF